MDPFHFLLGGKKRHNIVFKILTKPQVQETKLVSSLRSLKDIDFLRMVIWPCEVLFQLPV